MVEAILLMAFLQFSIDAAQVSSAPMINGYFYGLTVNPSNGEIVCLQAPSFTDAGTMARYTANGTAISAVRLLVSAPVVPS
jgi:hypothetical protein